MKSIEIPNSVTSIGRNAFSGCKGLTSIEIPSSVTSIELYAFDGCTGLKKVRRIAHFAG
ncbi:MAG: leucine-rich repeat domain-containing protein [Bacteroidales bacterium]|nr:leucine-rich repeat domain-containing protein [Bacteroidales bacterium]